MHLLRIALCMSLMVATVPLMAATPQDPVPAPAVVPVELPTMFIVKMTPVQYAALLDGVTKASPTSVIDQYNVAIDQDGVTLGWLYDPPPGSGDPALGNLVILVAALPAQYASLDYDTMVTQLTALIQSYIPAQ